MKSRTKKNRTSRKYKSESMEDTILIKSAKKASSKAIRVSKALGITIKVIRNNKIISINPDKTESVIRSIEKTNVDLSHLKKGMILERK